MHVRLMEFAGLLVFLALTVGSLITLFTAGPLEALSLTLLAVPLAYFLADLLTGVVHWICDSFGSEDTPIWGPMLVGPFRRHHRDPLAITRISVVENLGASAIAGTVALALARPSWGDHAFGWHLWVWFLAFAVVSNLFHRWAHWPRARKPRWMAALQRYRLLLPAREHLRHHRAPHRVNYCILSGWANALTNRVAWHRLEALLLRVGVGTHFD